MAAACTVAWVRSGAANVLWMYSPPPGRAYVAMYLTGAAARRSGLEAGSVMADE